MKRFFGFFYCCFAIGLLCGCNNRNTTILRSQLFKIVFEHCLNCVEKIQIVNALFYQKTNKSSDIPETTLSSNVEFHQELNKTSDVSEATTEKNVVIKKENGLIFYYPQYRSIEHVCGTMPDHSDTSVLMCCEAAYTGQLLNEFRHSNIAGNHVSCGTFYKGYVCAANSGYFEWDKAQNTWTFASGKYLQPSNQNIQTAFEQVLVIQNGAKCDKQAQKGTSRNQYRVLAEHDGKLCIIDSDGVLMYADFISNLLRSGVKHALYLDMGAGWNYSYYRGNDEVIHYIHNKRIKYTTNWIVFKKGES